MKKQPKRNRKNGFEKENLKEENLKREDLKEENFKDQAELKEEIEKGEKKEDLKSLKEKEMEIEIEKLKKENENFKELNLRLKAEFDNFKKRTQKEKLSIYDMAKSDCILPFLEVLDNLERAVSLVEKKDKFSEGIDLVVNKFYDVLKKIGIVEIKTVGEVFNPNFHEAIKVVEDEKFDKNIVCEVFQKGFMLNDLVVRHALVVVANP